VTIPHAMKLNAMLVKNQSCATMYVSFVISTACLIFVRRRFVCDTITKDRFLA
jgi:hypothetical protein